MVKKKDEIPKWVTDDIQNAKFEKPSPVVRTGYILEIFEKDRKMDVQVYDPVEDGRHIVTLDLPKSIKFSELERGVVYEFNFNSLKAPLSKKVVEFLKKEKEIEMDAVYQFELQSLQLLEEGSADNNAEIDE